MSLALSPEEQAVAAGKDGAGMAMRIVAESARLLGAPRLIPIASGSVGAPTAWSRCFSSECGMSCACRRARKAGQVARRRSS